jgi:hypothetical protein
MRRGSLHPHAQAHGWHDAAEGRRAEPNLGAVIQPDPADRISERVALDFPQERRCHVAPVYHADFEKESAGSESTSFSLGVVAVSKSEGVAPSAPAPEPAPPQLDYSNLLARTQLTPKYVIEKRLGKPGSFGVAYKVIDTLGDVSRAMKIVLRDRVSIVDRLKKEYKTLLRVGEMDRVLLAVTEAEEMNVIVEVLRA